MTSAAVVLLSLASLFASSHPEETARLLERLSRPAPAPEIDWVRVPGGTYEPLFPASPSETKIAVATFELAKTPVTNASFLHFVTAHPKWRRDRVSPLFADEPYLSHWAGPEELGSAGAERPVTRVSWFAAKAYCEAQGGRLPTEAEWELAASASETQADGRHDPAWSRKIISWYSRPSAGPDSDVGKGAANFFGVQDLHGLVWEWVQDFNSVLITADSRNTKDGNRLAFCGAGAVGSQNPEDYATFMRTAFRSSLSARYVARHLGFRCARGGDQETP